MNTETLYDRARVVLDVLQEQYRAEDSASTPFGHWMLTKYYPGVSDTVLSNCDDSDVTRALLLTRFATGRLCFDKVSQLAAV